MAARRLQCLQATGNVSGVFVDVAWDLARWVFRTALRFERAYIAVELTGAVQMRLALMHGTTRTKSVPTRAVVDVSGRVILKVAARESAVFPLRFIEHRLKWPEGSLHRWMKLGSSGHGSGSGALTQVPVRPPQCRFDTRSRAFAACVVDFKWRN